MPLCQECNAFRLIAVLTCEDDIPDAVRPAIYQGHNVLQVQRYRAGLVAVSALAALSSLQPLNIPGRDLIDSGTETTRTTRRVPEAICKLLLGRH